MQRCRQEHVTVNSALWAAFLAAQHELQGDSDAFRQRSALAVNTRDKLLQPAGEAFGFYASSLTQKLSYRPDTSFWDNARRVHARITKAISRTNLFRMLISDSMHPTLLDSLYFQKYGLIDEKMPTKLLRKMGWHDMTYGYALTNVGRLDIPTAYGDLRIESVHGPLFYSDVEEKMVGAITVGGRLSCLMATNSIDDDLAVTLKARAMQYLEEQTGEI